MMKVCIDVDEWYPVYSLVKEGHIFFSSDEAIDVPGALYLRWVACEKEFDELQEELSKLHDKS